MSMRIVRGKAGPIKTGVMKSRGEQNVGTITLEGPYSAIKNISFDNFVPKDAIVTNAILESDGMGGGKWTLDLEYSEDEYEGSKPYKVSWKIDMEEVQKDLKTHPSVVYDRANIERWLATDASRRIDENGDPQWVDENDVTHEIENDSGAWKYGDAYMRGIESYVVHYPVVEKISYYKSIPGCSTYNGTITGGSAEFSKGIDKWGAPDIKLAGYDNDGWLKSGDGYQKDGGNSWVRTERWTWTPDGRSSPTGWIYSANLK